MKLIIGASIPIVFLILLLVAYWLYKKNTIIVPPVYAGPDNDEMETEFAKNYSEQYGETTEPEKEAVEQ